MREAGKDGVERPARFKIPDGGVPVW